MVLIATARAHDHHMRRRIFIFIILFSRLRAGKRHAIRSCRHRFRCGDAAHIAPRTAFVEKSDFLFCAGGPGRRRGWRTGGCSPCTEHRGAAPPSPVPQHLHFQGDSRASVPHLAKPVLQRGGGPLHGWKVHSRARDCSATPLPRARALRKKAISLLDASHWRR